MKSFKEDDIKSAIRFALFLEVPLIGTAESSIGYRRRVEDMVDNIFNDRVG